jgi:hypothetical protein
MDLSRATTPTIAPCKSKLAIIQSTDLKNITDFEKKSGHFCPSIHMTSERSRELLRELNVTTNPELGDRFI